MQNLISLICAFFAGLVVAYAIGYQLSKVDLDPFPETEGVHLLHEYLNFER